MCGIVGIYNRNGTPVDTSALQRMIDSQGHRGPDDQGVRLFSLNKGERTSAEYTNGGFRNSEFEGGIAFNRLSILDPSENGHQPMGNRDATIFIAFNGEIYNAFDFRAELKAAGFQFRSNTDTEVVLYLYERYGFPELLERLNGMFAVSIVDLNRREIYLARDRMGIKPLYWYEHNDTFLFSSEVKSFLFHPSFRKELDPDRLDEYLVFRYCARDGFLLKNVRQLEPGCSIRLSSKGWEKKRYWSIPDISCKSDLSFERAVSIFEGHLQRSVKSQLLSDVKVGCQLSGGLDSSTVNLFATKYGGANMDAFSIIFDDPEISEERWIDQAAFLSNVTNHKYRLTADNFIQNLEKATWHLDQPLNHPNSLGIFCLAQNARSLVTVFLSGEGADELLGGYPRFFYAGLRPKVHPWLPILKRVPHLGKFCMSRFNHPNGADDKDWFIAQSAFQSPDHLFMLREEVGFEQVLAARRAIFDEGNGDYLSNCLKYEMETYMVDLLVRQDKMTMAHSMENRVPFLDHHLVTFVRGLSSDRLIGAVPKINQSVMRNTKVILKRLALKYFPPDFVNRPKLGFALPLKAFLRHPQFRPIMEDLVLPGVRQRGILNAKVVERYWRESLNGNDERTESIWICAAFEMWGKLFLDGNANSVTRTKRPGASRPKAVAP
jgi:asparagine synthase (glutamine-hydrolysing)